jgi:hypothetical protein
VKKTHRPRRQSGSTAEFGPALLILFLFAIFPLIDLLALATGQATVFLLANEAANHSSQSNNYSDALATMQNTATQFMGNGFAAFAKLAPTGGYNNCGANLWVQQTAVSSQQATMYGPNTGVAGNIDANANIYEYSIHARFNCGPLINLSAVPFIGSVPGLGPPATLLVCVNRAVEFPDGLIASASGGNPGGGSPIGSFPTGGSPGGSGPTGGPTSGNNGF